jgi:hypothetical protein
MQDIFAELRRDERYFRVLEPFLGRNIRQITHQVPGSRPAPSTPSTAITRRRVFAIPARLATCSGGR